MALLSKILGKDEKDEKEENLKKEIKSLEIRKESVLASINNEIISLQSEQKALFLDGGKYAYEIWCKDKTTANLTMYWNQVQELADKIVVQEAKKKEMTDRYNEEINLIASNLSFSESSNALESTSGSMFCPNCGILVAEGDTFCLGCGTKLQ